MYYYAQTSPAVNSSVKIFTKLLLIDLQLAFYKITDMEKQPEKPKLYTPAIISPLLVIAGVLSLMIFSAVLQGILLLDYLGLILFFIFLSAGLIWGIIADNRICRNKEKLTGRLFSISGVVLALVIIAYGLIPPPDVRKIPNHMMCGLNMSGLGKALLVYSADNNDCYPTSYKWCDLLVEKAEVSEKQFACPHAKQKSRSNYAINPNAEPNLPPDTVLLFETKGGWNQSGGPELMTFENHDGKGCNVLFNDGHIEFIKPDEVGKLKWK
jgi:prepilin-type processing-associated H-X9-DG protein